MANWYDKPLGKNAVIMVGSPCWFKMQPGGKTSRLSLLGPEYLVSPFSLWKGTATGKAHTANLLATLPVVEEALSRDEMEEREIVWDWKDDSAGAGL